MVGENRNLCPREYTIYHSKKDHGTDYHGGSALLIRNDTAHSPVMLNTPLEAVAIQIKLDRVYTVCSLYLSPNDILPCDSLTDLYNQLPKPLLLLGDVNGRHHFWGEAITNTRGRTFLAWIESLDLTILNKGDPTHFHVQTGSFSCIDLSMTSPDAFMDFDWRVLDDLHGSDHFPILVDFNVHDFTERPAKWNFSRANWTLFLRHD